MKTIESLIGYSEDKPFEEPRGILTQVHDETYPGWFRKVSLGSAGVVVSRDKTSVVIPLKALLELAEAHEPGLRPTVATEPAEAP